MPARALCKRRASRRLPRRRNPGSRWRNRVHRSSRSTSTRPSPKAWARKEGSASASLSSTTSTGRPTSRVSFVLRSTMRSKLASRRSTSTSTSLSGVSTPVAAEPNNSAKRTFCSVRRASRNVESNPHERRTYSRSPSGSSSFLDVGLLPCSVPWLTARRNVRSLIPTSSASNTRPFMCPLCHKHVSIIEHSTTARHSVMCCIKARATRRHQREPPGCVNPPRPPQAPPPAPAQAPRSASRSARARTARQGRGRA
jgi:hypothetical protein